MQSPKTHEQEIRTIERKGDVPKTTEDGAPPERRERSATHPQARQSEMPVSQGGMNQESRQHNKHNHSPAGGGKG